jgi:hypothetical protein
VIYLNDGTGQFTRVVTGMPMLGQELDGPASWADYSGDGNLDLLIANTAGPRELYWSDGNGRSALRVRCAGTLSDSRGVGSRVAIKATIAGNTSWYYRTSSGRDDLSMHFGLGDATAVDSLVVRWPITGMQILAPVSIDANLTITEPSTRSVPILLYPAHRSPDIPTTTMLRWRSSAGAMMYHLQVSTDTHFSSFEYNDSTLIDTTKILGPFALSTNYYWRVRAKDSLDRNLAVHHCHARSRSSSPSLPVAQWESAVDHRISVVETKQPCNAISSSDGGRFALHRLAPE